MKNKREVTFLITYAVLFLFIFICVLGWIMAIEKAEKCEAKAQELKKSLDIYESGYNLLEKANANLVKTNKSLRKRLVIVSTENEKLNLIIPIAKKLSAYIIGSANMCDMDTVLLLDYSRSLTKKIAGIKK